MNANILVVDDDNAIRGLLTDVLSSNDYKVAQAENSNAVQKALAGEQPDIVILDVKLGQNKEDERAGLDLLPQIKKRWADTEVIMLTGQGTVEMAMEAGRRGAYNFLSKPFETGKLLADVKCALERKEQNQENSALRRALETMSGNTSPIFRSSAMQDVVRTVERTTSCMAELRKIGDVLPLIVSSARRRALFSWFCSLRSRAHFTSASSFPVSKGLERKL